MFGRKFGFRSPETWPFYSGKKPIGNSILHSKCGFGIGYGIGRKYQPIWISVLVLDLNQNSDICRTLDDIGA